MPQLQFRYYGFNIPATQGIEKFPQGSPVLEIKSNNPDFYPFLNRAI